MGIAFKCAGIITLVFDAYLALAMLAIERMSNEYHHWLPPLGWEFSRETPRVVIVSLIVWSGFLAIGCLSGHTRMKSSSPV